MKSRKLLSTDQFLKKFYEGAMLEEIEFPEHLLELIESQRERVKKILDDLEERECGCKYDGEEDMSPGNEFVDDLLEFLEMEDSEEHQEAAGGHPLQSLTKEDKLLIQELVEVSPGKWEYKQPNLLNQYGELADCFEEPKVEDYFEVEEETDLLNPVTDYRSCPTTLVIVKKVKVKVKWSFWAWFINLFTKRK